MVVVNTYIYNRFLPCEYPNSAQIANWFPASLRHLHETFVFITLVDWLQKHPCTWVLGESFLVVLSSIISCADLFYDHMQ